MHKPYMSQIVPQTFFLFNLNLSYGAFFKDFSSLDRGFENSRRSYSLNLNYCPRIQPNDFQPSDFQRLKLT